MEALLSIYRNRQLLWRSTVLELKKQYAGSVLGVLWAVLGPALLIGLYAAIYVVVFQVRPVALTTGQYVLHVMSGLLPFMAFAGALSSGSQSIRTSKEVLVSTSYPPELLPVRAVLVASGPLLFGVPIIAIAAAVIVGPSWTMLLLPVVMLFQILFSCGIAWMLSLLTLAVKDIQHILQYIIISLLVVTPIAYTQDMVPSRIEPVLLINPLYYFVRMYQHALVYQTMPGVGVGVGFLLLGWLVSLIGFKVFSRVKQVFYDYA
ncbi:ABC transporter permease [Aestuariispira ectoiniformans]|uniref:ABC transporter permease n=1 Tax=Aestuariispira ectoiniformans TaxID=2775080 RepID=UPI00223BEE4A|nr:ABC transporter permease [Aestuariispira ectoiniformans]